MSAKTDQAVVLRLTEYSETSQIVTLFSSTHGAVRLIAKGARRSTRQRFAAGLDLLELGSVSFVPPRGDAQLGTLTEWVQRDAFSGLRRELLRLHGALYAAELVAGLTEECDPHPELYRDLVATLRGLAGPDAAGPWVPRFQAALLNAIGYAPNLESCVSCRHTIRKRQVVYFSSTAGGLICRDCEPHYVEKLRVSPELVGTSPASGDPHAWFELLDYHLAHVAERRFKTASSVAAQLARAGPGL